MSGANEMRLFDRDEDESAPARRPVTDDARRLVTEDIRAGLGQVVVGRGGELVDVRFNERALHAMRPGAVGDYLAAAINTAAARAEAARRRHTERER
jgi:hypothetical protein